MRSFTEQKQVWLRKKLKKFSTGVLLNKAQYRVYGISEEAVVIRKIYANRFVSRGESSLWPIAECGDLVSPWWPVIREQVPAVLTDQDRDKVDRLCFKVRSVLHADSVTGQARKRRCPQGFCFQRRKGEVLSFYFAPASAEVLSLLAANALKLFEIADAIAWASESSNLEEALLAWLND